MSSTISCMSNGRISFFSAPRFAVASCAGDFFFFFFGTRRGEAVSLPK